MSKGYHDPDEDYSVNVDDVKKAGYEGFILGFCVGVIATGVTILLALWLAGI